ncbi:hypothetical protein M378DRAFT_174340 [Amanita muscaria Koide BX008]|uniref:Uncharacterized protein n=1 Tax=Amanita muscaria (strain Koide BX008) TaxID=946122 RepID=A0A0C2RVK1_AMAMK|nr:hypothetical protein M378DRAFT_174340 [Amanita muscaria Koide BX008]
MSSLVLIFFEFPSSFFPTEYSIVAGFWTYLQVYLCLLTVAGEAVTSTISRAGVHSDGKSVVNTVIIPNLQNRPSSFPCLHWARKAQIVHFPRSGGSLSQYGYSVRRKL